MIDLKAEDLLSQYRETKDIEIERLLSQYGSSLKEVREMYPQLTETVKQRQLTTAFPTQPLFFTPSEAQDMGLALQEGWMLKMTPAGEGYTTSLITPQKWEITDNYYVSPTGEKYSQADMQALLSTPTGGMTTEQLPTTIENLTEEGKTAYQEYQGAGGQLDVSGWLNLREQQQLETEQVFGKVFPQQSIDEVLNYIDTNPEGFLADLRAIGRNVDTETLLKTLKPDITEEEMAQIFGQSTQIPEGGLYIAEGIRVMPDYTVYSDDNPSKAIGKYNPVTGKFEQAKPSLTEILGAIFSPIGALAKITTSFLGNFLKQAWKSLPINPYYWKSPEEQQLVDYKETLITWAKNRGIKDPETYVNNLMTQPPGEVTMRPATGKEIPLPEMPPDSLYDLPIGVTKGQAFIIDWVVPTLILAGLPSALAARAGLAPIAEAGGAKGAAATVASAILKPIAGYEQGVNALLRLPTRAVTAGAQRILQTYIDKNAFYISSIVRRDVASLNPVESVLYKLFNYHSHYMSMQADAVLKAQMAGGRAVAGEAEVAMQNEIFLLNEGITGSTETMNNIVAAAQAGKEITATSLTGLIAKNTPIEFVNEITAIVAGKTGVGMTELADNLLNEMKIAEEIKQIPITLGITPVISEIITGQPYTAIVYRGYKVGGAPTDEGLFGKGTYYSTNKEYAETYDGKEVMTVNLKNPFVINTQAEAENFWNEVTRPVRQEALEAGKTVQEADELAAQAARQWLESQGYDGLIARNIIEKGDEVVVFEPKKTVGPKIPVTEAGMPEAGLQPSMLEEVPAKEVRPTGKLVQARLDDYLRLRDYNSKAVADRIAQIKKLLETKGRLAKGLGTKGDLRLELARLEAQQEVEAVENMADLDSLIKQVEAELANRELPYHGGARNLFKGYTIRQLEEMRNVYQQARGMMPEVVRKVTPVTATPARITPVSKPSLTFEQFKNWDFNVPEGGASKTPKTVFSWSRDDYETLYDLSQQPDTFRFEESLGKGWKDWKTSLHLAEQIKRNEPITVYRASDVGDIIPGSYVSESLDYAKQHQENIMQGVGKIYSLNVYPDELMTYGDPHEFIYIPRDAKTEYNRLVEKGIISRPEVPLPEPPPEVINRVKTDPTPASDAIILKKFIECIKDAKPAREVTEALKHEELQRRSAIFASILQGGEGYKAFEKAKGALKGFLPQGEYLLDLQKFGITDTEIERMVDKIRLDDKLPPFQKLNTYEAFTNLIMGAIPTEGELLLLEKEFGPELTKAIMSKLPVGKKALKIAQDIVNIPRTLVTMADLSATFRQGALLAFGQPLQLGKAFVAQLKAIFSEKNFKIIDEVVHNNVYAEKAEQHKLYIAPISEVVSVTAREEPFMGRLIERVPILGSIVRASDRAYTTLLNVLRMETWASYCRQWEGTGKSIADYDKLASFINHATGRGDLGSFSRAAPWLSATFFSPRFIMSRIEVPLDVITATPAVRKVIARNLLAWIGAGLLALFLFKLNGAEVELDSRSSDFGKIKIGDTRIDFWAGYQPYVRVIAQIITEERKSTQTGEIYKIDPIDIGVNFFRSKLAPIPGLLWDLKSGKTFIGEELNAENAEKIIFEKLTPMFIQDLIEAVQDSGMAGIGYGILSALGIGVQTYSDNWESAELKLGLPQRSDNLPYTIENEVYDVKDYYSEISQMIGGATYEMLSGKKVPEKVLSVAKAKDILREINLLPNKRLTNINADSAKGDTFEQYRTQWLAREKITNADELVKFDKDYPDAYLGNITQAQYALLVQYNSLPDSQKAEFLGKHPEIYVNPREEWLRTHPEENALLVLWGKADPYSPEVLSKVSSLVKSLDIPENALVIKDLDAVTELKLKNQHLLDLLDAYGGLDNTLKGPDGLTARDRAIQQLYTDNPDFRDDTRRIEALGMGTVTNPTPDTMVEGWVERGQIADEFGSSSAEMKLWLIDNKEVHQWALENGLLTDTGEGWNENILRLQVNYKEDFDKYEALETPEAREAMLFSKDKMTSFGVAYYTINALQKNIPDNLVTTYVGYYGIRKQAGVDYSAGWYEDDWFLMSHPDFYNAMVTTGIWQARDFSKVPTRAVYSLYQTYLTLTTGTPRLDYRKANPTLDDWLVLAKGYKPAT